MKILNRLFTFLILSLISSAAYSQYIVNPVPGTWANKQVLVVNAPAENSVYYSLSDEDPEKSGIAYDGPALIDTDGDVSIVVAVIDEKGKKTLEKVEYKVKPVSLPENEEAYNFIENITAAGFIDYSAGDVFTIPSSLEYSFGKEILELESGTSLTMDKKSVLSRALPCTVSDGDAFWRFIILVHPVASGQLSRKDVPFEISNWTNVTIKDKKLIYKIDDGWWFLPKKSIKLDRTKSHMISWQDINYSSENIVKFFVLPPKPQIKTQEMSHGEITVFCDGEEGYKFGILGTDGNSSELFDQITIDTFEGDNFKGEIEAGVYFDSVYQGKMAVHFDVHKKLPLKPVITSSVKGNFIRTDTEISISSPEKNKIFASIAGPVVLDEDYSLNDSQETLFSLAAPQFVPLKKSVFTLSSGVNGAAAYKILAYCQDSSGFKSKTSEYTVIIDNCNYYVDSRNTSEEAVSKADGSALHPFTAFHDVIPLLENSRYVHLRVFGEVFAPNEKIVINSNWSIEGKEDARLVVGPNTLFDVRNSSLALDNIVVSLEEHSDSEGFSLFNVDRGVLYLNNVELGCVYGKNGTVVNADNSVVNIENSGITSSADVYSSIISSVNSKLNIKKSRISSVGQTSVNFSAQGGLFELKDSYCKVTGSMGRIAELFDTYSTIERNTFTGDLIKAAGSGSAVYFDSKNTSVEYSKNTETGF